MGDDEYHVLIPAAEGRSHIARRGASIEHVGKRTAPDLLEAGHARNVLHFIDAHGVIDIRVAAAGFGKRRSQNGRKIGRMARYRRAACSQKCLIHEVSPALHHAERAAASGDGIKSGRVLSAGMQRSKNRLLPQRELSIEIRALAQHLDRVDDVLLHALGPIFKHGDLCRRRAGIDHKNSLQ